MRRLVLIAGLVALLASLGVGSSGAKVSAGHWRVVYQAPATDTFADIADAGPTSVWAVGSRKGVPLVGRWDGAHWRVVPGPLPSGVQGALTSVAVVAANDVWVAGSRPSRYCTERLLAHWNGSSWTVLPNPPIPPLPNGKVQPCSQLDAVGASGAGDIWAAGGVTAGDVDGPGHDRFVAEHWDGSRLSLTMIPVSHTTINGNPYVGAVVPASSRDVWVVGAAIGEHSSFATHWSGRSWRESALPGGPARCPEDEQLDGGVAVAGRGRWAVGSTFCDEEGGQLPLARHWNGTHWRVVETGFGFDRAFFAVDASSPRDVWAVGSDVSRMSHGNTVWAGMVARWDGARWTRVPFPLTRSGSLHGVAVVSPSDVWAIGERLVVRYSSD